MFADREVSLRTFQKNVVYIGHFEWFLKKNFVLFLNMHKPYEYKYAIFQIIE